MLKNEQNELLQNLEKTLESLIELNKSEDIDLESEINRLKDKIIKITSNKKIYKAWEKVELARSKGRATTLEYIDLIFDDFIEFHGDRLFSDDKAIVAGIAKLNGFSVTIIGHQKGRNVKENIERNFGMPHPEGYRKSLRIMRQAEKFKRPIICFIDTPGAYCGLGAEERGQGEAIARNLFEMSELKVPIISIIIGEGGSGGALALGVGNRVHMLKNTIYSILSPEGFASILYKDVSKAKEAADYMKITSEDLLKFGIIDSIIEEGRGAHIDKNLTAENIKNKILEDLDGLFKLDEDEIVDNRYSKFRSLGKYSI